MAYNVITKLRQGGATMKPIDKTISKVGNSYGIILDKFILEQSEIKPTDKVEISFAKNRITIKKKKEKE
jgi:antitoxin component of MazEF toxin-antitoxin module